jgi:hypothetical protein
MAGFLVILVVKIQKLLSGFTRVSKLTFLISFNVGLISQVSTIMLYLGLRLVVTDKDL